MKAAIRILSIISLGLGIVKPSFAQWIQTNGPYGSEVTSLCVDGTDLFAGTPGAGVFLSTDNSANWTPIDNGLSDLSIQALSADGSKVYAGTSSGVFVSTNAGSSWNLSNAGLTNLQVNALASDDSFLFAGTSGGVFRSSDNGATWESDSSGLTNPNVHSLLVKGDTIFAGSSFPSAGGSIPPDLTYFFRSTDHGASWDQLSEPFQIPVNLMAANNTYLFISFGGVLYRSSDGGNNWSLDSPDPQGITAIAVDSTDIFAGNDRAGAVMISTDNGDNWQIRNNGLTDSTVVSLVTNGSDVFAGGFSRGVFRSTDDGLHWTQASNGLSGTVPRSIASAGGQLLVATGTSGVFESPNGGTDWTSLLDLGWLPGMSFYTYSASALCANDSTIYIGSYGGVVESTNNGSKWTVSKGFFYQVNSIVISPSQIYAGTNGGGVYVSTDNGATFNQTNSGLTDLDITTLAFIGQSFLAGTDTAGVFISTDDGTDWTAAKVGIPGDSHIFAFSVDSSDVFAATDRGILVSTDEGKSWVAQSQGLPPVPIQAIASSNKNLYAGTDGDGVYFSANYGATWNAANAGLPAGTIINCLSVVDSSLFAGTPDFGVWFRPLSQLVTDVRNTDNGTVVNRFDLNQNYPNPFNPSTVINYELPASSHVTLKIYDVLGRVIATLVNGQEPAGSHSVTMNGSGLPSGVYFYHMQAGTYSATKKLLLLK